MKKTRCRDGGIKADYKIQALSVECGGGLGVQ